MEETSITIDLGMVVMTVSLAHGLILEARDMAGHITVNGCTSRR